MCSLLPSYGPRERVKSLQTLRQKYFRNLFTLSTGLLINRLRFLLPNRFVTFVSVGMNRVTFTHIHTPKPSLPRAILTTSSCAPPPDSVILYSQPIKS